MAEQSATGRTVLIAGAANIFVGVIKLAAGILVGSSAMLAEAAHSAADTLNQGFLWASLRRSARPADERHPFGYGQERYFWSLLTPAARPLATLRTAGEEWQVAESTLRDAVVDALGDEADKVELRTALGLAGRNLIDTARRVNAQLIVLAGRGSTSMLLGTVSQYVLRKAPCPVLVVPEAG